MLILGIIILLLAALFIAYVVLGADGTATLDAANIQWEMPALTLFLSGMGSLLAVVLGLWLISRGTKATARKRRKTKELERQAHLAQDTRTQPAASRLAAETESRESVDYSVGTDERSAEAYPGRTEKIYDDRQGDRR